MLGEVQVDSVGNGGAEGDRRGDANAASRPLLELTNLPGALRDVVHRAFGVVEVLAPRVCQAKRSGRALDEPYAERRFESGDAAAHRRYGNPALTGSGSETPPLHYPHEQSHVVEVQVHFCIHDKSLFPLARLVRACSMR